MTSDSAWGLGVGVDPDGYGMGGTGGSVGWVSTVGGYAFASAHEQGALTNAQAEADNVPLEIDGVCCYNFRAK